MKLHQSYYLLSPGSVISVRYSLYKHFAIVSDSFTDGKPNLISLSHRSGGVLEEPWSTAVGNRPFELSSIQGNKSSDTVLACARSFIGSDIRYNVVTFNCEHFVRLVHGLPVKSKQVRRALYGAMFGTASCILLPKITLARLAILISVGAVTSLKSSLYEN